MYPLYYSIDKLYADQNNAFVLATAVLLGGGYLMRRFEARLSEAAERALPGPLEALIKAKGT